MGYIKTFCQDSFQSSYSDSDSPPVADEDLLAEDGAVGAEEVDRVEGVWADGVLQADAVLLAVSGRVCVVAAKHQTIAGEPAVLKTKNSKSKKHQIRRLTCVAAMIG